MVPIIILLCVLSLSPLITRVATVALAHTGLSREAARFQARSAFTGVGFTTNESEKVVNHPVRRRILMTLMFVGNAGIVTVVSTLIVTFLSFDGPPQRIAVGVGLLAGGLCGLLLVASSTWVDRRVSTLIGWALARFTSLDVRDYDSLLQLNGEYRVGELFVEAQDWLAGRTLATLDLRFAGKGSTCSPSSGRTGTSTAIHPAPRPSIPETTSCSTRAPRPSIASTPDGRARPGTRNTAARFASRITCIEPNPSKPASGFPPDPPPCAPRSLPTRTRVSEEASLDPVMTMNSHTPDLGSRAAGRGALRLLDRMTDDPRALQPPRTLSYAGRPRRVGVEVEFAGLDLEDAVHTVVREADGTAHRSSEYECEIETPRLGRLRLEVDNQRLKWLGRKRAADGEMGLVETATEHVMSAMVGSITPLELVTPPLPPEALPALDDLVAVLGEAGARGTEEGILSAFGTHYNPEVATLDPHDLLDHLRAFVLLFDWLREQVAVDFARRLTPFVDPFPPSYAEHVLTRALPLSTEELIDEYLRENASRNRALDLLPLFAFLDEPRVSTAIDDPRVKARPTFHYRLTNSHVGREHWRVSRGWRLWLIVEDLAGDPERLATMTGDYLAHLRRSHSGGGSSWAQRTGRWLS